MFAVGSMMGSCLAQMAGAAACSACHCFTREIMNVSARLGFSFLFFLSMIASWILRDFARPLIEKIPWIMRNVTGFEPSDKWFGQQAVYRISMGNFLFFATLSAAMVGVRFRNDPRARFLHHGNYALKMLAWLLFSALPFLFPNGVVASWAWAAHFGGAAFLALQMIILLDFFQSWNESWVGRGEGDVRWLYALLGFTVTAYGGAAALAGAAFHWFRPAGAGACSLNTFLITTALLLVVGFSLVSLHPVARGGSLFPSALIALYTMYLTLSALQSEPADYECNGLGQRLTAVSSTTMAAGFVVTLASVVYSAFQAGSNSALFSLQRPDEEAAGVPLLPTGEAEEASTSAGLDGAPQEMNRGPERPKNTALEEFVPVAYSYSFFHVIFALASMYISMLMTGWGAGGQDTDRLDVGWFSVWVKAGAMAVTALLYAWSLLAPAILSDREF